MYYLNISISAPASQAGKKRLFNGTVCAFRILSAAIEKSGEA